MPNHSSEHLLFRSGQCSDLAPIFGDLSKSKKLSEIKLPLIVDHTCTSYEGHEIKHQKNPWKMGTFINTSEKVSIFNFWSIFTNKIHCDLIHGINTNETWKTSVTRIIYGMKYGLYSFQGRNTKVFRFWLFFDVKINLNRLQWCPITVVHLNNKDGYNECTRPERIYKPIMATGFSVMYTFQLDNTNIIGTLLHCCNSSCRYVRTRWCQPYMVYDKGILRVDTY